MPRPSLSLLIAATTAIAPFIVVATARAQDAAAPPLVKQINNGNWLTQQEAESLRDEMFYQRAVFAYQMTLPALNIIGIRDGSEATLGKGYNILPIWKDRMDARAWIPTLNADVIYSMSYLDLKETGPLVVATPRDVIGMFTDFFQRTITDVGAIGPDRARGGLYLLLPPDYDGEVPKGYTSSNRERTTSSLSSGLLWSRAIMGLIRNRRSHLRNRRASIRYGPWRKMLSRCSFQTAAAKPST
jgi:hypothetical protein